MNDAAGTDGEPRVGDPVLQARMDRAAVEKAEHEAASAAEDARKAKLDNDRAEAANQEAAAKAAEDARKQKLENDGTQAANEAAAAKARTDARIDAAKAVTAEAAIATDQRKADAEARKAEAENEDHDSPDARLKREADAKKGVAEAEKDAAAARRAQLTALLPDLGEVKESILTTNDGPAVSGTMLTFGALGVLGRRIADDISERVSRGRILVTSEPDLASTDGTYQDVSFGLDELGYAATLLLTQVKDQGAEGASAMPVLDLAAALSAAIPGVLSLFAAKRSLATATVTVSDLAACAAIAGALTPFVGLDVVHDDFRLVPRGATYAKVTELSRRRHELSGTKIALTTEKARLSDEREKRTEAEKELRKAIADAGQGDTTQLRTKLSDTLREAADLDRQLMEKTLRLGLVESLVTSIDEFLTSIRTVPAGAKRSPLGTASLQELLTRQPSGPQSEAERELPPSSNAEHTGTPHMPESPGSSSVPSESHANVVERPDRTTATSDDAKVLVDQHRTQTPDTSFTHVLLVKAQPGQTQQLLDNKPLWFEDKFATIVDISVTFLLIHLPGSEIVRSGTMTSTARAFGALGAEPSIVFRDPEEG